MKSHKNKSGFYICNLYIFIWILYLFHWQDVGEAVPILDSISNILLSINLLISAYYTLLFWKTYKQSNVFLCVNVFLLSLVLYGLFSVLDNDVIYVKEGGTISSGTYMIAALRTFLPVYTCFIFSKFNYITEKLIKLWLWLFLLVCILIYFIFRIQVLGFESLNEMRTNNTAYLFVSLLPLLYFYKEKPIIQYVIIVVLLFLTILGLKRGAILIFGISMLYFFFHSLNDKDIKRKWSTFFIIILFLSFVIGEFFDFFSENEVLNERFTKTLEGYSSGRDEIAIILLDKYFNADLFNLLFGFGADATLKVYKYAHNDWLELLFNQGLVGVLVFLLLWVSLYKLWLRQNKQKTDIAFLIGLWFLCNFPRSIFSMWYSMANIITTLPLGYFLAKTYSFELKSKRKVCVSV